MVLCVFEVYTYTLAEVTVVAESRAAAIEAVIEWFTKNHDERYEP